MSLEAVLKIYVLMNILLASGYGVFWAMKKFSAKVQAVPSDRQWIKTAQSLMLLTILAPVVFQLLPRQELPNLEWGVLPTFEESALQRPLTLNTASRLKAVVAPAEAPKLETNVFSAVVDWLTTDLEMKVLAGFGIVIAFGIFMMFVRLLLHSRRLLRLLKGAHVIRSLGRIRIAVSSATTIPFSLLRLSECWVVIPIHLLERHRDLQIVVKHELQHHRQGDTWWALLIEMLICLFFPNPAIYLWKKQIIELQEFSCDEALIGQKGISALDYGRCLVRVAEAALEYRQMYVGPTYMATISKNPNYYKSFLRRRIEMFTRQERPRTYRWAGALTGTAAVTLTIAIAFGAEQTLREKSLDEINPGKMIVDPAIQAIADKILTKAVKEVKAKGGFAIVADPNTGQILAVANIDTKTKRSEYWALSQALEPASIMKTLVAAQAIEKGKTTPEESHNCENGTFKFGGRTYHDYKVGGWDHLTTTDTIANSSDICSMKIGKKIGVEGVKEILRDYGFGPGGTAKDFPLAKTGSNPSPEDLEHPRLVPHVSAGFGFLVTPIELIQAYGAIANGGKLMKPVVHDKKNVQGEVIRQVLTPENAEKMKEILRQVVVKGTAKGKAESALYSTAGKTATSYLPDLKKWDLMNGRKRGNFAGFIGFAPVKNPKVEVYVGILEPQTEKSGAAHGNVHAAPVFRSIVDAVLTSMNVPADKAKN